MKDYNKIINLWNTNFNKGVTIFQIFLMGTMILGCFLDNYKVIYFSTFVCLLGYFEPSTDRFSLRSKQ